VAIHAAVQSSQRIQDIYNRARQQQHTTSPGTIHATNQGRLKEQGNGGLDHPLVVFAHQTGGFCGLARKKKSLHISIRKHSPIFKLVLMGAARFLPRKDQACPMVPGYRLQFIQDRHGLPGERDKALNLRLADEKLPRVLI
jgi:hypothetical protein